jgi:hypothetical protein
MRLDVTERGIDAAKMPTPRRPEVRDTMVLARRRGSADRSRSPSGAATGA